MNRYDKRIAITPEKVGENLRQEISTVLPKDEKSVIPSINRGVPFVLGAKGRSSPVARSIFELAEVVRERIAAEESS